MNTSGGYHDLATSVFSIYANNIDCETSNYPGVPTMALISNFGKRLCTKPNMQIARSNNLVRIAFDSEYHLKMVAHRTENSTVQTVTGKDILLEFNCKFINS